LKGDIKMSETLISDKVTIFGVNSKGARFSIIVPITYDVNDTTGLHIEEKILKSMNVKHGKNINDWASKQCFQKCDWTFDRVSNH
jgi:hypothetical protein